MKDGVRNGDINSEFTMRVISRSARLLSGPIPHLSISCSWRTDVANILRSLCESVSFGFVTSEDASQLATCMATFLEYFSDSARPALDRILSSRQDWRGASVSRPA